MMSIKQQLQCCEPNHGPEKDHQKVLNDEGHPCLSTFSKVTQESVSLLIGMDRGRGGVKVHANSPIISSAAGLRLE